MKVKHENETKSNHKQKASTTILNNCPEVADMGDRLATIFKGLKTGGVPLYLGGELGTHLTQCRLGRRIPSYEVAS